MKNTLLFLLFSLTAWACSEHVHSDEEDGHAHDADAETHADETDIIHLTTAQVAQAGIGHGNFTQKTLGDGLNVNAELTVHPEHTASVTAFSDGIITDLRVVLNANVRKGQVLAVVRKPDLLDMQQQFLENKDRLVFLQAEHDRYKSLKDADATAAKNFQKADADLRAARTARQVLAAKLRQYQIDPDKLTATNLSTQLTLVAPVNGVVTAIHANVGAAVQSGTPVCQVTDMSQLHADLWIFEKDILKVKNGQQASLAFPADRTKTYPAVVYSMDKVLDPGKRALRIHAKLEEGTAGRADFVSGAFMEARIATKNAGKATALPEDAVVREGEADFIFIFEKEGEGEQGFRKIPVQRGASEDGFVVVNVLEALPPGAKIVVKGAYYVSAQGTGILAEHEH